MPPAKKKPLTSAERARNYRERKAKEAKAAAEMVAPERDAPPESESVTPVTPPTPAIVVPATLRQSVEDAIRHMKWLKPTDFGIRDMALMYASMIDDLRANEPEATGKAASLGQLLARLMAQLGGAPTVRLQHELRSLRLLGASTAESGDDGSTNTEGDEGAQPEGDADVAPVIPIRPPKRKRA